MTTTLLNNNEDHSQPQPTTTTTTRRKGSFVVILVVISIRSTSIIIIILGAVCGTGYCTSNTENENNATNRLSDPATTSTTTTYDEETNGEPSIIAAPPPPSSSPFPSSSLNIIQTTASPPSLQPTATTTEESPIATTENNISTSKPSSSLEPSTTGPTTFEPPPSTSISPTEKLLTTNPPTTTIPLFDGMSGEIVTRDCMFQDYGYAIDIYWSCGSERFNNPLRLHTFKRHSLVHQQIFNDQKITYRNDGQLWFDSYNIPRCISISNNDNLLILRASSSECDKFKLILLNNTTTNDAGNKQLFHIQQAANIENCIVLGDNDDDGDEVINCNDDESTGGSECGGIDHRYLPISIGLCNNTQQKTLLLSFQFETHADDCTNGRNEYPSNSCFL